MSLTREQRESTSAELRANLELSGETTEQAAAAIDVSVEELEGILAVSDASPVKVWMLRDHLESAVRELGLIPHRYTTLTPDAKASAVRWFGLTLKRPQ